MMFERNQGEKVKKFWVGMISNGNCLMQRDGFGTEVGLGANRTKHCTDNIDNTVVFFRSNSTTVVDTFCK